MKVWQTFDPLQVLLLHGLSGLPLLRLQRMSLASFSDVEECCLGAILQHNRENIVVRENKGSQRCQLEQAVKIRACNLKY